MNTIKQLSIFVSNVPGSLAHVVSILKDCNINMKACNLAESTEFGILRAIVDQPEEAVKKLIEKNIIVTLSDIVGIAIKNVPGSMFEATDILGKAGINILYGYAYTTEKTEGMFVKVDNTEKACEVLAGAGLKLISESEL